MNIYDYSLIILVYFIVALIFNFAYKLAYLKLFIKIFN